MAFFQAFGKGPAKAERAELYAVKQGCTHGTAKLICGASTSDASVSQIVCLGQLCSRLFSIFVTKQLYCNISLVH